MTFYSSADKGSSWQIHQQGFRDNFISRHTKYTCAVVVLRREWRSEHFCPGVSCMDLTRYVAMGSVKTFCECTAWKNSYDQHCSGVCCLRNTLKPTETETLNGTCLSLLVMSNFQGYFVIFLMRVKVDIISVLFLFMLREICWVNSVISAVFEINSSPFCPLSCLKGFMRPQHSSCTIKTRELYLVSEV